MRVANINTNIEVMKRRIQMKTSAQMGHKYIVGPPWINGKPGGVSLWMAHKTIYGINANIILGWRHKFSHLHALNLGNDFWSSSTRQRPGAWMRSDMCFCLC